MSEPFANLLTSDQRRKRTAQQLAEQFNKPIPSPVDLSHLDGTVTNRSELWPFAEYRQPDGSTKPGIAWPGLLSGELPQMGDRSPEAADQYGRAVLSNVMLMGAPRGVSAAPTNALGALGGRIQHQIHEAQVAANPGVDPNKLAQIQITKDGKIVASSPTGNIHASPTPSNADRISMSFLDDESMRGRGYGGALYDKLAEYTLGNGRRLESDYTVSPDARAVWENHLSKNYDVQKTPGAKLFPEKYGAEPGTLMGPKKGSPVFSIGPTGNRPLPPPLPENTIFGKGPNPVGGLSATANAMERPGIRAYHGSPHDFDRFDMSKIGTGEGAQAYGHGMYGLLGMLGGGAANEMLSASPRPASPQYRPGDA